MPITLQPRSPYFALLDFCHFKANEMSERQGGRDSRGEENERKNKDRKSKKERGGGGRGWSAARGFYVPWASTIDAKPRAFSSLSFGAIKYETRKRGVER